MGNSEKLVVGLIGNPGFRQEKEPEDPAVTKKILDADSTFSIRDGNDLERRVQEIKEFIYGWAKYRHPRFS